LKNEKEASVGPDNLAQIRFPVVFFSWTDGS